MKATLTFELPEDRAELQAAVAAQEAWSALDWISSTIRSHEKHDLPIEKVLENIKLIIADALLAKGEA